MHFLLFLSVTKTPDKEQIKREKVHFSSQFKGIQSAMEVKTEEREEYEEMQGVGYSNYSLRTGRKTGSRARLENLITYFVK